MPAGVGFFHIEFFTERGALFRRRGGGVDLARQRFGIGNAEQGRNVSKAGCDMGTGAGILGLFASRSIASVRSILAMTAGSVTSVSRPTVSYQGQSQRT